MTHAQPGDRFVGPEPVPCTGVLPLPDAASLGLPADVLVGCYRSVHADDQHEGVLLCISETGGTSGMRYRWNAERVDRA